jgi:hypothetical protein
VAKVVGGGKGYWRWQRSAKVSKGGEGQQRWQRSQDKSVSPENCHSGGQKVQVDMFVACASLNSDLLADISHGGYSTACMHNPLAVLSQNSLNLQIV